MLGYLYELVCDQVYAVRTEFVELWETITGKEDVEDEGCYYLE